MRLRQIRIHTYRQFIDQRLEVLPDVTVLVGRNDSGKTGLMLRLIDQHFFERVVHGSDQSRVPGPAGREISFDTVWEVSADDYRHFRIAAAFRRDDVRTVETQFRQGAANSWQYIVNGDPLRDAYITDGGRQYLRPELGHHGLFPDPHYLNVGDQTGNTPARLLVPFEFEAQFFDPTGYVPVLREHLHITPEAMLLRLAGFHAITRNVTGPGIDAPWEGRPHRSPVAAGDVQQGLNTVAARITEALQKWWKDPDGLTCHIRIHDVPHSHEINSFLVSYEVRDRRGLELHGSGLRWFISFLIQIFYIEDAPRPLLLLADEPATPLHPGAQRTIVGLLNTLSARHQVVYTTHSPFMLDWSFPQRIRVLERDPDSRRTTVINRPYVSIGTAGKLWEPLRASIGTTMGGIATIGQKTVLVEGISDQIILANASAHLKGMRRTHFDLEEISIVPYGEEISLKQLLRAVRAQNTRMVVLVDTDEQGVKAERLARREGAPFVHAATFAGRPIGAIEDIVGPDDYVRFVNEFYQQFPWFRPLDVGTMSTSIGNRTLGRFLEDYFEQQFQQSFSKVAVSILMTYQMDTLSPGSLTRLEALIGALVVA